MVGRPAFADVVVDEGALPRQARPGIGIEVVPRTLADMGETGRKTTPQQPLPNKHLGDQDV